MATIGLDSPWSASPRGAVVQPVETKYAWLGRDRIAYQVLGEGPPDLVVSFGSFGHIDIAWKTRGSPCSSAPWRPSRG
jgi:hypothetical protein